MHVFILMKMLNTSTVNFACKSFCHQSNDKSSAFQLGRKQIELITRVSKGHLTGSPACQNTREERVPRSRNDKAFTKSKQMPSFSMLNPLRLYS